MRRRRPLRRAGCISDPPVGVPFGADAQGATDDRRELRLTLSRRRNAGSNWGYILDGFHDR
jgi:hypothetical protein